MDLGTYIAIAASAPIALGAYSTGKTSALGGAASINQLLQSRIEVLEAEKAASTQERAETQARIAILEGLVTQKADVASVQVIVGRIESKVDAIADKVGADVGDAGSETRVVHSGDHHDA